MLIRHKIHFETAKLLKDCGFREEVMDFFYKGKWNDDSADDGSYPAKGLYEDFNAGSEDYVSCPTLEEAMQWLRDDHRIAVLPKVSDLDLTFWDCEIIHESDESWFLEGANTSYEEAAEEGIAEACKFLLEHNMFKDEEDYEDENEEDED